MSALTPEETGAIEGATRTKTRGEVGRAGGRQSRKSADEHDTGRMPERIPFQEQRQMLNTDLVPDGYHGHWFANIPGRLEMALKAGYSFVTKDGTNYSDNVAANGTDSRVAKSGNDSVTLYLMIIPNEWYQADQELKHKRADELAGAVFAKQKADPDFYARDDAGNQTHASKAGRVHIEDSYL